MRTSNKHFYSGRHSRKSSRLLRGDAEETLRATRVMLFSQKTLGELFLRNSEYSARHFNYYLAI